MPDAHALLSASGAHRWLECTPSARLEEAFPESASSYAAEGTLAHEVAANCALYWTEQITEAEYENTLNKLKQNDLYTADMLEDCINYAKLICDKWNKLKEKCPDATVMIEAQIKYAEWAPEGFGTADCLILADGFLEVIDFKYGKGKRVDALGNPQMRMYTLGAYSTYGLVFNVEHITMTIYQPRLSGVMCDDEITIAELLKWGEEYVKPRAALAFEGKGNFCPSSEVCKFCKAKQVCRARANENLKQFDEAPDILCLTPDEAGQILEKADDIKAWLTDLENLVQSTLLEGQPVKGWKIVEGRSNRRYADETKVAAAMKAAGYNDAVIYKPKELITLTQMEKDFGKKNIATILDGLIIKPAGKPTLAPETDKRPEFKPEEQILKAFDEEA